MLRASMRVHHGCVPRLRDGGRSMKLEEKEYIHDRRTGQGELFFNAPCSRKAVPAQNNLTL
ncbi:MAG: hypothetical protein IKK21_04730 [Clostridia bacterium]|nr:hypothetical protein [Clostridia bacterium]